MITSSTTYLTENNLLGRTPVYRTSITKGPRAIAPPFTFHWSLDETSGNRVNTYPPFQTATFTSNGSVGSTSGKIGNAASFNGTSQYLSMAGSNYPLGDVSFGGRVWVLLSDNSISRVIVGQWGNTAHQSWVVFYDQSINRFSFLIGNGTTNTGIAANFLGAPLMNVWYEIHWKRYRNPSGVISIQVNTETTVGQVNSLDVNSFGPFIPIFDETEDIRVGASRNDGVTISQYWSGRIDELTLTNQYILSPEEEAILYDNGLGNSIPIPASKYTTYSFDTAHDMNAYADLSATPTTAISAMLPTKLERKLEMAYSRFPLSNLTMRIKNQIGSIALFLAGCTGSACTFDGGFWDYPGDYARWFSGVISDVQVDEGDYLLTAQGTMDVALQAVIFNGAKTHLASAINAALVTWPVESTEGFANEVTYVLVDNEITQYIGIRPGLIAGVNRSPTYPYLVPVVVADGEAMPHSSGAEVSELINLGQMADSNSQGGINSMHPVDIFGTVLLGNTPPNYPAVARHSKAVLPAGFFGQLTVDTNRLDYTRNVIGPEFQMAFLDDEPVTVKDFLEKEIMFPLALYPTETINGVLGMLPYPSESDYNPPYGVGGGYDVIDDNHALAVPQYDKAAENRINQVHYYYDYNPIDRSFAKLDKFIDDNLVREHGKPLPLEIYSKGIRSRFDGSGIGMTGKVWFWDTDRGLLAAAQRHLSKFGSRCSVLRVETILRDHIYECGDDVTALFANVPDEVNSSVTTINRPTRLEECSIDFEKNTVSMSMLEHTGFQASVHKVV